MHKDFLWRKYAGWSLILQAISIFLLFLGIRGKYELAYLLIVALGHTVLEGSSAGTKWAFALAGFALIFSLGATIFIIALPQGGFFSFDIVQLLVVALPLCLWNAANLFLLKKALNQLSTATSG